MDIHLLRKVIYGMQYGDDSFENVIMCIKDNIHKLFGSDMKLIQESIDWVNKDLFEFHFLYLPYNYTIIIESDKILYSIGIYDAQGAFTCLNRIKEYNAYIHVNTLENAINLLKEVLIGNNFDFFISKDNKIYRKNIDGIKRIKNIEEFYNG